MPLSSPPIIGESLKVVREARSSGGARHLLAPWLALLVGCGSARTIEVIDPAMPADIVWVSVLSYDANLQWIDATGIVAQRSGASYVPLTSASSILVLGYTAETMANLSAPGADTLLRSPLLAWSQGAPELPPPDWNEHFELRGDRAIAQDPISVPRLTVSWLKPVASGTACTGLASQSVPVPVVAKFLFLTSIEGGAAALVGATDGTLFRVTSDGRVTVVPRAPGPPIFTGAFDDGSGQLWLGTSSGALYRGALNGTPPLARVGTASVADTMRWFVGTRAGEPFELFGLGNEGSLVSYDPTGRPTVLFEFPFQGNRWNDTYGGRGGLVRVGPGRLVAGRATLTSAVLVIDGRNASTRPIGDGIDGFPSLDLIPESPHLVAMGDTHGQVERFNSDDESFDNAPPPPFMGAQVAAVARFQNGFAVADGDGVVTSYPTLAGPTCGFLRIPQKPMSAIEIGRTILFAGEDPATRNLSLDLVRAK
jgi:hypothetical protein